MITVQYAKAFPNMRINAVEPGYAATDLNNHTGVQTVEEGAGIIVRMAQLGPDGPTGGYFAGPAVTVRIADNDAVAINRALLAVRPGSVLVVDMSGDHRHAPVGAVTAAAAKAQGAAAPLAGGCGRT